MWGWRRYPGFGPWSHLPPWERPGWRFGRGWCWMYLFQGMSREDELEMLEEEAKFLEERLNEIRRRIEELKK